MRVALVGLGLLAVSALVRAGDEPRAEDAKAIQELNAAFTRAYNDGDAKAVAAFFTEDARLTDDEGTETKGRTAIERTFADIFADDGGTITITTDSLRFLTPDVAEEEGRSRVVPADGGEPEVSRYTVLYVKKEGRWLHASVRERPDAPKGSAERLKALEFLLGEWVSESEDGVVYSDTHWADGKNFLVRAFSMRVRGRPALTGTQMIGYDPLRKQIRSWVFDSGGGVGEGLWSRKGDTWLIKTTGFFSDGRTLSATQVVVREGKDRVRWHTTDRTLGGEVLDNVDEIVLVRKPPQPK